MQLSKSEFDYVTSKMPRPCVDLVFVCKGKTLLMRRLIEPDKGLWALPGGSVNLGETVEQAAVRKAKEEAGIVIDEKALQLVGVLTYFGKTRQDICTTYRIELAEYPMVTFDFQHDKAEWFIALPSNASDNAKIQTTWSGQHGKEA